MKLLILFLTYNLLPSFNPPSIDDELEEVGKKFLAGSNPLSFRSEDPLTPLPLPAVQAGLIAAYLLFL
jgi:hypothetical protein